MRRRRGWLGVLAAALFAIACAPPATPPGSPRFVRAVLSADPASLSLIGNQDNNSSIVARLLSDGLVDYDASMRFRPKLAASWEVTDGGRTVTFRLRDGARWHDGRPVTARDVAFTFGKLREPATQGRGLLAQMENVTAVEPVGDRVVIVRYREPYADYLDAWRMPILPEHLAGREPDLLKSEFAKRPVGCGPFRFVRFEPGVELVVESNPDYWAGPPAIAGIRFKILRDERTAYQALLKGELDFLGVSPDVWTEAATSPEARRLARDTYFRLATWSVAWNTDGSNPFFGDPRVRRAMLLALDREKFGATVLRGMARPAVGTWLPESGWADPRLAPLPYDPDAARRLLTEAGWALPAGGTVRERDGRPFRFALLYPAGVQEVADRIAAWIQQSLADVGVSVDLEKAEWRASQQRRREHRFEAAMFSLVLTPSADQFELYHSSQRESGMNHGGFADPEVDRLLEAGRRTFDPAERARIYHDVQQRLAELQPVTCLFQFAQGVLRNPDLRGVEPSPLGLLGFDPGPRAWRWAEGPETR